jgi:hypothetical protein
MVVSVSTNWPLTSNDADMDLPSFLNSASKFTLSFFHSAFDPGKNFAKDDLTGSGIWESLTFCVHPKKQNKKAVNEVIFAFFISYFLYEIIHA